MTSDRFSFHEITACRNQGHKLRPVWSDKNLMKMHIVCDTCSLATGKSVFVAYGMDSGNFGQWRAQRRKHDEEEPAA